MTDRPLYPAEYQELMVIGWNGRGLARYGTINVPERHIEDGCLAPYLAVAVWTCIFSTDKAWVGPKTEWRARLARPMVPLEHRSDVHFGLKSGVAKKEALVA